MFYFNPISYFFKSFIRLFTKKFFWVILILLLICIGWALYDKGVFAVDYTQINTNYFTENEINTAKNYIGESIWNNEDYDIILYYVNGHWGNYKAVLCFNINSITTDLTDVKWKLTTDSYGGVSGAMKTLSDSSITWTSNNNNVKYVNLNQNPGYTWYDRSAYFTTSLSNNSVILTPIRSHFPIYNSAGVKILDANASFYTEPYIENESSIINNWSFDYLHINSGSETIYFNNVLGEQTTASLYLDYVYNDIRYRYQIPANLYGINTNDTFDIYIPRTSLLNNVNITNGSNVSFYLGVRKNSESVFPLGSYTFALTTEEQEQIQQDSDKALQGEILGAQQETNNKLDSLENTITDTTIPDDAEFDLPTIEVNDSTANFFDTLFTGIYNAFNTNEDTSISFTIFSKTITINSADFRMLNDNGFTILRNLLESSWYFAIGYMILKDIRHIFDKIKTGNIENAVSNDIKADMV